MRTQRPSLHLVQTPLGVPRPYTHLLALLCAVPSGTKRGPRHHDRRGQPNRRAPRTRWKCAQRERRPPGRGEKTPCVSPKRATVTQRGAAEGRPPDTQTRPWGPRTAAPGAGRRPRRRRRDAGGTATDGVQPRLSTGGRGHTGGVGLSPLPAAWALRGGRAVPAWRAGSPARVMGNPGQQLSRVAPHSGARSCYQRGGSAVDLWTCLPSPTHGAGPGGGGGDAETRRCVQHGGPGAMSHSAGGAGSSGTRVLTPPRLLSAVAVPQDPGDRGTEGTPTVGVGTWPFRPQRGRHPTTVPVLQVARGRENKNLRYSTISWETKERPLLPSLLS